MATIKWEEDSVMEARAGTMCQNAGATFDRVLARSMTDV